METERWVPVPSHDGYEVSDHGRIRSLDRVLPYEKNGKILQRYRRGHGLRPQPNESGHLSLCLGRANRHEYVHRLVLAAFVGPCPAGMECLHGNGEPSDNRLVNLRWGTPSENGYDKVRHGTHWQVNKKKCKRGHDLAGANLPPFLGTRLCWSCELASHRRPGITGDELVKLSDEIYADLLSGWRPIKPADRIVCSRGHRLEYPNLVPSASRRGQRECLSCSRAGSWVRSSLLRRGVALDKQVESDRYFEAIIAGLPADVRAEWICNGRIKLADAQHKIVADWVSPGPSRPATGEKR